MNSTFLTFAELASPKNHSLAVIICNTISGIYGILIILLTIAFIIVQIVRKECNIMTVYSFHLAFSILINGITFLIPDPEGNEGQKFTFSESLSCNLKALIHLASLTLTVNLLFIFYVLNYLMFVQSSLLLKQWFFVLLYGAHWLIVIVFVILYAGIEPGLNSLYNCRYKIDNWIPQLNSGYSALLIVMICVIYCLIRCTLNKSLQQMKDIDLKTNIKYTLNYFILVAILALFKIIIFIFNDNFVIKVIDRISENLIYIIVFLLFVLGMRGIKILTLVLCCKDTRSYLQQKNTLTLDEIEADNVEL
jgi:hypothetical protein